MSSVGHMSSASEVREASARHEAVHITSGKPHVLEPHAPPPKPHNCGPEASPRRVMLAATSNESGGLCNTSSPLAVSFEPSIEQSTTSFCAAEPSHGSTSNHSKEAMELGVLLRCAYMLSVEYAGFRCQLLRGGSGRQQEQHSASTSCAAPWANGVNVQMLLEALVQPPTLSNLQGSLVNSTHDAGRALQDVDGSTTGGTVSRANSSNSMLSVIGTHVIGLTSPPTTTTTTTTATSASITAMQNPTPMAAGSRLSTVIQRVASDFADKLHNALQQGEAAGLPLHRTPATEAVVMKKRASIDEITSPLTNNISQELPSRSAGDVGRGNNNAAGGHSMSVGGHCNTAAASCRCCQDVARAVAHADAFHALVHAMVACYPVGIKAADFSETVVDLLAAYSRDNKHNTAAGHHNLPHPHMRQQPGGHTPPADSNVAHEDTSQAAAPSHAKGNASMGASTTTAPRRGKSVLFFIDQHQKSAPPDVVPPPQPPVPSHQHQSHEYRGVTPPGEIMMPAFHDHNMAAADMSSTGNMSGGAAAASGGLELFAATSMSHAQNSMSLSIGEPGKSVVDMARSHRVELRDDGAFEMINQYMIIEELGRGASGAVYLALHQDTEVPVAIKTIVIPSKSRHRHAREEHMRSLKHTRDDSTSSHSRASAQSSGSTSPQGHLLEVEGGGVHAAAGYLPNVRGDTSPTPPNALIPTPAVPVVRVLSQEEEEIRIMRKMNHPNILKLIEVIDDDDEGAVHLVMEYCENGPLLRPAPAAHVQNIQNAPSSTCGSKPALYTPVRPMTRVAKVTEQICKGLRYLHQFSVLHRDIKPENILVAADDVVKIADFGVSARVQRSSAGSGTSDDDTDSPVKKAKGTPAFMAPEILDGRVATKAADVWSFGVTLFVMIFGVLPFKSAGSLRDQTAVVLNAALEFPPLAEVPESGSLDAATYDRWCELLRHMLDKDPAQRMTLRQLAHHPLITSKERRSVVPHALTTQQSDASGLGSGDLQVTNASFQGRSPDVLSPTTPATTNGPLDASMDTSVRPPHFSDSDDEAMVPQAQRTCQRLVFVSSHKRRSVLAHANGLISTHQSFIVNRLL